MNDENPTIVNGLYMVLLGGTEYYCKTYLMAHNLLLTAGKHFERESGIKSAIYSPVQWTDALPDKPPGYYRLLMT